MKTIGIKLADGSFYPVLEEFSNSEKHLELTTAHNNQTKVMVDLYRSKTCSMDDAEYVDSLQIENLVAHPNGEPDISFTVSIDENNKLSAKIKDTETGNQSKTTITLVSRTLEERLVTDEYKISDAENENIKASKHGFLAMASKVRKQNENSTIIAFTPAADDEINKQNNQQNVEDDVEAVTEEVENNVENNVIEDDIIENEEDVPVTETSVSLDEIENMDRPELNFDFPGDDSKEVLEKAAKEFEENPQQNDFSYFEEDAAPTEPLADNDTSNDITTSDNTDTTSDAFDTSDDINSASDDTFDGIDTTSANLDNLDDIDTSNSIDTAGNNFDDIDTTTDDTVSDNIDSTTDDTFALDNLSENTQENLAPLPDFDETIPDFDDSEFDAPAENNEEKQDYFLDADETSEDNLSDPFTSFDLPEIDDENSQTDNEMPDDFFDLDNSLENSNTTSTDKKTSSGPISFTGLYDKETELGQSSASSEDENIKKKTKVPVIICIICAIICILATILVLFIVPSKYNLLNKQSEKQENKIAKQEEQLPPPPIQWEQEEGEVDPEPETEPETEVPVAPPAQEEEIVIIEQAEIVVPEQPPVTEEKPENILYKIKWGDTLWDIADTYYKNPWRYKYIARFNNIKDPDYIISGTYITIPAE